ncbi:ATP-binding protein [Rubidibacter lacunae]|uniref:hypothetical protein n=1 Tax=Rubidibacter lacunae TaxID=582514 RepID=UPI0003F6A0F3|nr:hypothetical protein [Rubidibacter lacunae]
MTTSPPPYRPLLRDEFDCIAAGEVNASQAAAERELTENAIDAGAKRIAISLQPETLARV